MKKKEPTIPTWLDGNRITKNVIYDILMYIGIYMILVVSSAYMLQLHIK